jgi:hypothetical protein
MAKKKAQVHQTRLAVAALAACIIEALGEEDENMRVRFERALERAYAHLRDSTADNLGAMETLSWTKEILRKL